jgi:hypothetical protein
MGSVNHVRLGFLFALDFARISKQAGTIVGNVEIDVLTLILFASMGNAKLVQLGFLFVKGLALIPKLIS